MMYPVFAPVIRKAPPLLCLLARLHKIFRYNLSNGVYACMLYLFLIVVRIKEKISLVTVLDHTSGQNDPHEKPVYTFWF